MASFRRAPAAAPKYFVIPNFPPAQMAKQNGLLKHHIVYQNYYQHRVQITIDKTNYDHIYY
jgi:hypothetical protein